jgi:hypothetical protein
VAVIRGGKDLTLLALFKGLETVKNNLILLPAPRASSHIDKKTSPDNSQTFKNFYLQLVDFGILTKYTVGLREEFSMEYTCRGKKSCIKLKIKL